MSLFDVFPYVVSDEWLTPQQLTLSDDQHEEDIKNIDEDEEDVFADFEPSSPTAVRIIWVAPQGDYPIVTVDKHDRLDKWSVRGRRAGDRCCQLPVNNPAWSELSQHPRLSLLYRARSRAAITAEHVIAAMQGCEGFGQQTELYRRPAAAVTPADDLIRRIAASHVAQSFPVRVDEYATVMSRTNGNQVTCHEVLAWVQVPPAVIAEALAIETVSA